MATAPATPSRIDYAGLVEMTHDSTKMVRDLNVELTKADKSIKTLQKTIGAFDPEATPEEVPKASIDDISKMLESLSAEERAEISVETIQAKADEWMARQAASNSTGWKKDLTNNFNALVDLFETRGSIQVKINGLDTMITCSKRIQAACLRGETSVSIQYQGRPWLEKFNVSFASGFSPLASWTM